MYGTLRLILALMVALSHYGVLLPNFNQGVFAVAIFYLLAGMVSYKLITNQFVNAPLGYYKNRINRIFPLYFIVLIVAIGVYFLGVESYFLSKLPSLFDFISNIVILPLSYYMFTEIDKITFIPPAWSLAVELQFYLLAPFIFTSKKTFITIFVGSFSIFLLAMIGILDTDLYGYRLLIGVIFIFLLGSLLQQAKEQNYEAKRQLIYLYGVIMIAVGYLYFIGYKASYNYEVLLALLIGIPLLFYMKTLFSKSVDLYLGNLSYAIFLIHFPAMWIYQLYFPNQIDLVPIFLITFVLAIVTNFFTTYYFMKLLK